MRCSLLSLSQRPLPRPPVLRLLLLAVFASVGPAAAQVPANAAREAGTAADIGRRLRVDPNAADATGASEFAPKLDGDEEYGVQRILYKRSNWEPWSYRSDMGGGYTSNVALTPRNTEDDFFFQNSHMLGYTPQLGGGWFLRTAVGLQSFRYDQADLFDFDMLRGEIGPMYAFPRQGTAYDPLLGDLLLYANYNYYRITEPWEWDDVGFDNHGLGVGAEKTYRITRGQKLILGLGADLSIAANRDEPRRHEYAAGASYVVDWTESLQTSLAYRFAWYDYDTFGREDANQIASLNVEYKVTDWFRINASVSGIFNESNLGAFDYDAFNTGLSIAGVINW